MEQYQQGETKITIINDEEIKLGYGKSDFLKFKETGKVLKTFEMLWKMIGEWEKEK